jgi:hypothetical protein
MLLEEKSTQSDALETQVERILHSDELRTSEVLRRILKFLLEKTLSGEADQLKEYTVAIDCLGKPSDYDPQHNSAVRLQVSRLRQKLAEYYRVGGKNDAVLIDIPKGRFKLISEVRYEVPTSSPHPLSTQVRPKPRRNDPAQVPSGRNLLNFWTRIGIAFAFALLTFFIGRWSSGSREKADAGWTPELQVLWGPFLDSSRPLLISIEDPLFVQMRTYPGAYFRDRTLNSWAEATASSTIEQLRGVFKNQDMQPSRYYTTFGEASASFLLGQLLRPRAHEVSFVKASQLSFQQLADNNVIFVGVQNLFFDEKVKALPIASQLMPVLNGIQNLRPDKGQPAVFVDQYSTEPTEEGYLYALITHVSGPLGNGQVESFTSNRSAGYLGAVEWLTDPKSAKLLVSKLKDPKTGQLHSYYQVLLKVKFKDDVPTETTYVLSRIL